MTASIPGRRARCPICRFQDFWNAFCLDLGILALQLFPEESSLLTKYFKPGQKVQIHSRPTKSTPEQIESLTAYVSNSGADYLDLTLPYRLREGELFPFHPGAELELLSQALGLGVRTLGKVADLQGEEAMRVECHAQLEAFQRRAMPRIDVPVGLRYARGQGHLRSLRAKWEKQLQRLAEPQVEQPGFTYCPVNLSGGGIRFNFREAPLIAELCLLLMELSPDTPPVCALAEVVWLRPAEKPGLQTVGMQFTHIRKADQDRICRFVTDVQKQQAQAARDLTEP